MPLPAIVLAIFVYGMSAALLGSTLPDVSSRYGLSPKQNGTIALLQALGLMLASITAGPLIDAWGTKSGLVMGLAINTAALVRLPRLRGFRGIGGSFLLLGLGGGLVVTSANALASSLNPAHRGSTLNLLNLFFGLGAMATPMLARKAGRVIAGLTGTALVLELVTPVAATAGAPGFVFSDLGMVLRQPTLWLLASFLLLYVACEVGIWNWLTRYLIAQGVPERRALQILSLGFALGLLTGRLAAAPVLTRVPGLQVTLCASVAIAGAVYCLLQTRKPAVAWALVFVTGLAMGPVFPTTLALVGDAFPRLTGTAMGLVITCGWLGLAVSSRVIGSLAGDDPRRLKRALLLLPAMALGMVAVNLALQAR